MKRIIIFILFIAAFSRVTAQTYDPADGRNSQSTQLRKKTDPLNTIKVNILSPFYNNISAFYQHVMKEETSLQLGLSYMNYGSFFGNSQNDYKRNEITTCYTVTPEYRYNLNGKFLSGIYFGAFLRYINMEFEYDEDSINYRGNNFVNHRDFKYQTIGLGLLVGHQFIFKRKVCFDLFAGPVYNILMTSTVKVTQNNQIISSADIPNLFLRQYGVRAGICVGFVF